MMKTTLHSGSPRSIQPIRQTGPSSFQASVRFGHAGEGPDFKEKAKASRDKLVSWAREMWEKCKTFVLTLWEKLKGLLGGNKTGGAS